jgi:23S rRNA (cytidine1920-2'-O)/16S rRNA (cytidine1409-2'-O)-methyltransferase
MRRPDSKRERVDVLLVERGLAPTRARAQALILAGRVHTAGTRVDKPGTGIPRDAPLDVLPGARFVGRGGDKLDDALPRLGVDPRGRDAIDVGASTGGFTQVLLAGGARRVIALDVGRGQLDWQLRTDDRVVPLEGLNARYLRPEDLPFVPDLGVVDVSFISLELVLPALWRCIEPHGEVVALVKPQFEVGRSKVGRGGIVREASLHREVLIRITEFCGKAAWPVRGLCASSLRGATGNQEYFVHLSATDERPAAADVPAREIAEVVATATGPAE